MSGNQMHVSPRTDTVAAVAEIVRTSQPLQGI